jgi:hypothetical protein
MLMITTSVLGFKVMLGRPAIVTSPGLVGCVKWRCDPAVRLAPKGEPEQRATLV